MTTRSIVLLEAIGSLLETAEAQRADLSDTLDTIRGHVGALGTLLEGVETYKTRQKTVATILADLKATKLLVGPRARHRLTPEGLAIMHRMFEAGQSFNDNQIATLFTITRQAVTKQHDKWSIARSRERALRARSAEHRARLAPEGAQPGA